jgi:hypothetical protein
MTTRKAKARAGTEARAETEAHPPASRKDDNKKATAVQGKAAGRDSQGYGDGKRD